MCVCKYYCVCVLMLNCTTEQYLWSLEIKSSVKFNLCYNDTSGSLKYLTQQEDKMCRLLNGGIIEWGVRRDLVTEF